MGAGGVKGGLGWGGGELDQQERWGLTEKRLYLCLASWLLGLLRGARPCLCCVGGNGRVLLYICAYSVEVRCVCPRDAFPICILMSFVGFPILTFLYVCVFQGVVYGKCLESAAGLRG